MYLNDFLEQNIPPLSALLANSSSTSCFLLGISISTTSQSFSAAMGPAASGETGPTHGPFVAPLNLPIFLL
jgi:hypothetical protein